MNLLGYELTVRKKALPQPVQSVLAQNWWSSLWGPVSESTTGAWQRNVVAVRDTNLLLSSSTVYACVTGIATDVAKLPILMTEKDRKTGIWEEVDDSPFLIPINKPNHYQTRIKFIEQWMVSKLLHGNAYILKRRDERGMVDALYVLHPMLVVPLIADSGDIFYDLRRDYLSGVDGDNVRVPASEIIHDSMVGMWHPLIGISPLFACAMSATLQARIQDSSATLFGNKGMPGGILTHPGHLSQDIVDELKARWQSNYTGDNVGKIAVLADGLKFEAVTMTALNQQLADQLKWTVEDIARAFHYPLSKLAGPAQPYTKPEESAVSYYTDCLQIHLEWIEAALDSGLSVPPRRRFEFDTDNLLRMDTASLFASNNQAQRFMTVNEQRRRVGLPPIEGGDTVYLQEQDHSLEALSERDEGDDPFGIGDSPDPEPPSLNPEPIAAKGLDPEHLQLLLDSKLSQRFAAV